MTRDLVLAFSVHQGSRVCRFGKLPDMSSKASRRAAIIGALHSARLAPYLAAAQDNQRDAIALYGWNVQLAAALQEVLSVAEVVLRNAIDRELQAWNDNELGSPGSWLLTEPAAPLRSLTQGKRKSALELAQTAADKRPAGHWRHGLPVTHDDVLTQVMFGMWKEILPNHYPGAGDKTTNDNRERMWTEALIHAFPNITDPDGSITFWRVYHLHQLRNRVSHGEPLLAVDASHLTRELFGLVRSINEAAHDWLTGLNRVPAIVRTRPC